MAITLLANLCVLMVEYVSAAGTGVSRGTLPLSDWDWGTRYVQKRTHFRQWPEDIFITQIQQRLSIKPAPPSCPVCPAQLPLHQRTHPHWSDCWAPPVKIIPCYDHRAKYVNSVSTRFCIRGRFYILDFYIHILFWRFPIQFPELREERKVLNTVAAWWSGGALEMVK